MLNALYIRYVRVGVNVASDFGLLSPTIGNHCYRCQPGFKFVWDNPFSSLSVMKSEEFIVLSVYLQPNNIMISSEDEGNSILIVTVFWAFLSNEMVVQ